MSRYCKICGAKSGRCNHLILDFGERQENTDKKNDDTKKAESQK